MPDDLQMAIHKAKSTLEAVNELAKTAHDEKARVAFAKFYHAGNRIGEAIESMQRLHRRRQNRKAS